MGNAVGVGLNRVNGNVSGPDRQKFPFMTIVGKFAGCCLSMHFSMYIFIHILEKLNFVTFHIILHTSLL